MIISRRELMELYFKEHIRRLGIGNAEFLGLGRKHPEDPSEDFCMTVLALRLAASSNGVSKLHGAVSRQMWNDIWPGVPDRRFPSVTSPTASTSEVGFRLK